MICYQSFEYKSELIGRLLSHRRFFTQLELCSKWNDNAVEFMPSEVSIMNWKTPSTSVNQRMRRIEEILDAIPYFFGSMLDDVDLQTQLLAEPGKQGQNHCFHFFGISRTKYHHV